MAGTDSLDVLKTVPIWLSPITEMLVAFPGSHPIETPVPLHVNTAVVPSGTGDGLSSVPSSVELTAVTTIVSVITSLSLPCYAS